MGLDKGLISGSTTMLVLKLLEDRDLYGYLMIEELAKRSNQTFSLKAGTLYPILHGLEKDGVVTAYDEAAEGGRMRKYYHLTGKGRRLLAEKRDEWAAYSGAVNRVLEGGVAKPSFSDCCRGWGVNYAAL